ncbi:Uncharacterised protein [Klebsiella pneumoniae]|uniref:Succinate-semialdehyde dehydrogenase n=1 Tax=Klebsiella pneumoniae TaxID=573 RepID=A0A3S4GRA5_KLEPN|nr:Uncharacterised protein [Klebsiella pneumoniae]
MHSNDMTLFRQQALIDGQWRDAPTGGRDCGHQPGQRRAARQRAEKWAPMKPAKRLKPPNRALTRLARPDRQRAGEHSAPLGSIL